VTGEPDNSIVRRETPVAPYDHLLVSVAVQPKAVISMSGAFVDVAVTITNAGSAAAPNANFSIQPSAGTLLNPRIVTTNPVAGWSCTGTGYANATANCSRAMPVEAGGMAPPVVVRYDVASGALSPPCRVNVARRCVGLVTRTWSDSDGRASGEASVEIPFWGFPELTIDLSASAEAVRQGQPVRFDVTVANGGPIAHPGPVIVGLYGCRPDTRACQQVLGTFAGPVGANAGDWTCLAPWGGNSTSPLSQQLCSHAGPLAAGATLSGSFEWTTWSNVASFDAGRRPNGRACISMRAAIGEIAGTAAVEAHVPLVPRWDGLGVPGGGTADVSGPAGTEFRSVAFSAVPADMPIPTGTSFPVGMLTLHVLAVDPGDAVAITLDLPRSVMRFYTRSPDGSAWSTFMWDGATGAQFGPGNRVTLTLRDGGRGDADGAANGSIVFAGAAANDAQVP
jgi:hypothetical protein